MALSSQKGAELKVGSRIWGTEAKAAVMNVWGSEPKTVLSTLREPGT